LRLSIAASLRLISSRQTAGEPRIRFKYLLTSAGRRTRRQFRARFFFGLRPLTPKFPLTFAHS
jgi:hypothetical protein